MLYRECNANLSHNENSLKLRLSYCKGILRGKNQVKQQWYKILKLAYVKCANFTCDLQTVRQENLCAVICRANQTRGKLT